MHCHLHTEGAWLPGALAEYKGDEADEAHSYGPVAMSSRFMTAVLSPDSDQVGQRVQKLC